MMTDRNEPPSVVLFVDDDPHILAAMRRAMHAYRGIYCGIYVARATDALEIAASARVDAIVTDIVMPGTDGFELIEGLQANPSTRLIPIIVVTGHEEEGLRARALKMGASDLLTKPVDNAELRARLSSVLRLKEFHERIEQQNRALAELLERRTDELLLARLEMLWKLSMSAEMRDNNTGQHIARVGCSSRVIADAMGLSPTFVEMLAVTAPLHDIGKIGIPDAILLKPGSLTDTERAVMETHCMIGARVLRSDDRARAMYQIATGRTVDGAQNPLIEDTLRTAREVALCHHEWWDGSGYPVGLAGADIPRCARIVAIADVFDALCTERPYKRPMVPRNAAAVIAQQVGTHFDPEVHRAFVRVLPALLDIRSGFPDAEAVLQAEAA